MASSVSCSSPHRRSSPRSTTTSARSRRSSSPVAAISRAVSLTLAEKKSLNLWTIWMTALAVAIIWAAFLVREVLLIIYMSGLLAIGFSPIVRLIERQRVLPVGTRRFPRWLAILILYLFMIGILTGIGFLIVPPLVQ